MSIYTAIVSAGGKPSIPFQERELNMTACCAVEAGIYPIPDVWISHLIVFEPSAVPTFVVGEARQGNTLHAGN